jgi:hypothetical protein
MKNSLKNFFPTPKSLISTMLSGIDWNMVESVLEPSAGKGDLADEITLRMRACRNGYYSRDYIPDVDCIEINPELKYVLNGKGYRTVYDDFLKFQTYKHYSMIIMNPPFDRGPDHLLHAIRILEEGSGGSIVCILNADSIADEFEVTGREIDDLLEWYRADISYHDGMFKNAERQTNVRIALVKVTIPDHSKKSIILEDLKQSQPIREIEPDTYNDLAQNDYVKATVDKFNFEAAAGIQLIRDYKTMEPIIQSSFNRHSSNILDLSVNDYGRSGEPSENEFLRLLRKKYWEAIFLSPQFSENFTSNLLSKCRADVDVLKDYDINEYNIHNIRIQMQNDLIAATEQTILDLFEYMTNDHHWFDEMSKNRHYFTGWKTNKAYKINRKVILPLNIYGYIVGDYSQYGYRDSEKLADIEKVLQYLSWKNPDKESVTQILHRVRGTQTTKNISCRYFNITCYKKGTTHITFKDEELLKKFNYFGCQKKKWLPPSYAKKTYTDMTKDEKEIVDSYEGQNSYNESVENAEYLLSGIKMELNGC